MKIRGASELIDYLAGERAWRRVELTSIANALAKISSRDPKIRERRNAIVFSYAHWEGFVKNASIAYLKCIFSKSRPFSSLAANLQALVCRQELLVAQGATRRINPHLAVVSRLVDCRDFNCSADASQLIDTESNLNAEVFADICISVGIDFASRWATWGPFMNDLVRYRCQIAHGEFFEPEEDFSQECVDFVIKAMDSYATDLENMVLQGVFLRQ
ncbi:MAG: MAE_28990/MAE_18760 family HEPN-like nuclease [Verrucomicrobiota bacterium JB022]|nr:MAE_28990/MAE_18760 family HEPN-like nuclease [Verrucomicrobiota bacterium JB022]